MGKKMPWHKCKKQQKPSKKFGGFFFWQTYIGMLWWSRESAEKHLRPKSGRYSMWFGNCTDIYPEFEFPRNEKDHITWPLKRRWYHEDRIYWSRQSWILFREVLCWRRHSSDRVLQPAPRISTASSAIYKFPFLRRTGQTDQRQWCALFDCSRRNDYFGLWWTEVSWDLRKTNMSLQWRYDRWRGFSRYRPVWRTWLFNPSAFPCQQ